MICSQFNPNCDYCSTFIFTSDDTLTPLASGLMRTWLKKNNIICFVVLEMVEKQRANQNFTYICINKLYYKIYVFIRILFQG